MTTPSQIIDARAKELEQDYYDQYRNLIRSPAMELCLVNSFHVIAIKEYLDSLHQS